MTCLPWIEPRHSLQFCCPLQLLTDAQRTGVRDFQQMWCPRAEMYGHLTVLLRGRFCDALVPRRLAPCDVLIEYLEQLIGNGPSLIKLMMLYKICNFVGCNEFDVDVWATLPCRSYKWSSICHKDCLSAEDISVNWTLHCCSHTIHCTFTVSCGKEVPLYS